MVKVLKMDYNKFKKNKKEQKKRLIAIGDLTDEQREKMKVQHYTLHLPSNMTREQLSFIQKIAKLVELNEPITIVHEKGMQHLLKWSYNYRNILTEFDEQDRWTEEDDTSLEKIAKEFKPILDWLIEQYKLDVSKFRRD